MIPIVSLAGCAAWSEDLKAYLDDELPTARRRTIEEHLKSCDACRKELRIMEQIQEELRADEGARTATLDPALKARILENADVPVSPPDQPAWETEVEAARTVPKLKPRSYWMEYGLLASLVVLITIGSLTLMGGRIKNTFNTAAGSINTSTDDDDGSGTYNSPPASVGAANQTAGEAPPAAKRGTHLDGSNYDFTDGHVKWHSTNRNKPNGSNFTFGDDDDNPNAGTAQVLSRKVHRQASLTVSVKNVEQASDAVESRVREANGYVVSNALSTGEGDLKTANLEIKVPVSRFEAVVRQVSALGNVRAKDVSGQDITEQYISANARKGVVSNELSVREAQLRELEKKAKRANADQRWQLAAEIRRLRIEAAEAKARLNWLQKSSDMSDISVTLQQEKPVVAPTGFMEDVGKTGKDAWASFTMAARIPVTALIWIIAYCPFWIPALILWRKYGGFGERHRA
jgi:Flp pilus assembly pilin Flp